ncbi:divalent metal cation transporter [Echinicola strongylocentroti]|uniref:Divalent metal cation transporter n=1 Tax=Echinicola strongylocentroti TaxID=1795355 RepID=A0A2Z4IPI7_9BACT|nr:Nramp family divalent metal transporter [Echinicola strongylocentroti]AWW32558.1 divalent metal cation transporter [Echinicola strongylocentroti]
MKNKWIKQIGPGPLVAAAFIGPGTVTVCSMAGVRFGYELLWALLLSIIATAMLQEMAARIGLITQKGLPEAIRSSIKQPLPKLMALGLVIVSIVVGNAAYEAGNLTGAVMGLEAFIPSTSPLPFGIAFQPFPLLTGLLAWALLMRGNYKTVERFMVGVVLFMSMVFLVTALVGKPPFSELITGFIPSITSENTFSILALIGTTVVPYNLFLHSSLVAKKWHAPSDLRYVRMDTYLAVLVGGLVSMAIMVTGALGNADKIEVITDLSESLKPLLGDFAPYFLGLGLFAAGITSSITAPLAGALVICGCFGWDNGLTTSPMRWTFSIILLLGIIFSSLGIHPVRLIGIAQLTNGILLPVLSTFILWMVNKRQLMGKNTNPWWANLLGLGIWIITCILGIKSILNVVQNWNL